MGTPLANLSPASTADTLLKTNLEGPLTTTLTQIGDGAGNDSPLFLATDKIGFNEGVDMTKTSTQLNATVDFKEAITKSTAEINDLLTATIAASTYLSTSTAASTYLTQANAASTYLTIATAASTYQPIGSYLTSVDIANINATGTPSGSTYLRGDGTWAAVSSGSVNFNDIGDASASGTVDNLNYNQAWSWSTLTTQKALQLASNTLTTGTIFEVASAGTAIGAAGKGISSLLSGANATGSILSYAGYFSNVKTHGTRTDNRAIYATVQGGTTFYSHAAEFVGPNGAGFFFGDRGDSIRAAIWATAVGTPSAVNYAIVADAVHTVMNGTSNVELTINDSKVLRAEALGIHLGAANLSPVSAICSFIAPTASANKGLVSLGNGTTGWTGGANAFAGSANGTFIAINSVSGYTGDWLNFEKAGTATFTMSADGVVSKGTWGTGAVIAGVTMTLGSDATGDIYYRNSGGVLTRLGVGTDGQVLTLASGLPSWAAASGGGSSTLGTLGAIAANASVTQGNYTLAWNWTGNTTTNPVTWTGSALTTGTLFSLASGTAMTTGSVMSLTTSGATGINAIPLKIVGHLGGGLKFGNYNATHGGIWSNAISTISNTNYAFIVDSTGSTVNATTTVTLKIADSTKVRIESTGVNFGSNSSPLSVLSVLSAPTASANIALLTIGNGGYAAGTFGTIGNAAGTMYGGHAASGFTGDLIHLATNSVSAFKVSYLGDTTIAGTTITAASTTTKAGFRILAGTAPSSPTNGDIWQDGTDLKIRIGGVTKTVTLV